MTAITAVLAGIGLVLGNAQGTRARIVLHIGALLCGVLLVVVGVIGIALAGGTGFE